MDHVEAESAGDKARDRLFHSWKTFHIIFITLCSFSSFSNYSFC